MRALFFVAAVTAIAAGLVATASCLGAAEAKSVGPDPQLYQTTVSRAIQFLTAGQSDDGSLSAQVGIGPTALAVLGLLRSGRTADDPKH